MNRPGWAVSQTRVCETGSQVTPFSLFRCGSQRHSAMRISWRESDALRPTAASAPAAPESPNCRATPPETPTPTVVGVALSHIYQDVGVCGTSGLSMAAGGPICNRQIVDVSQSARTEQFAAAAYRIPGRRKNETLTQLSGYSSDCSGRWHDGISSPVSSRSWSWARAWSSPLATKLAATER